MATPLNVPTPDAERNSVPVVADLTGYRSAELVEPGSHSRVPSERVIAATYAAAERTEWELVGFAGRRRSNDYWAARCVCGALAVILGCNLRRRPERHTTCGGEAHSHALDLTGETFGDLTAVERVGTTTCGFALWRCRCICGAETVVESDHLRRGHTVSCNTYFHPCSYAAAHKRVRRTFGPASANPCIDCGAPAADWAYDGCDPTELSGPVTDPRCDKTREVAWSRFPEFYMPLCKSCHTRRDGAAAKARRAALEAGADPETARQAAVAAVQNMERIK